MLTPSVTRRGNRRHTVALGLLRCTTGEVAARLEFSDGWEIVAFREHASRGRRRHPYPHEGLGLEVTVHIEEGHGLYNPVQAGLCASPGVPPSARQEPTSCHYEAGVRVHNDLQFRRITAVLRHRGDRAITDERQGTVRDRRYSHHVPTVDRRNGTITSTGWSAASFQSLNAPTRLPHGQARLKCATTSNAGSSSNNSRGWPATGTPPPRPRTMPVSPRPCRSFRLTSKTPQACSDTAKPHQEQDHHRTCLTTRPTSRALPSHGQEHAPSATPLQQHRRRQFHQARSLQGLSTAAGRTAGQHTRLTITTNPAAPPKPGSQANLQGSKCEGSWRSPRCKSGAPARRLSLAYRYSIRSCPHLRRETT